MEKVQHRISRCVVRTQRTSKMDIYLTALLIIVAKLSILDVCGFLAISLEILQLEIHQENIAPCKGYNRRRMQNENIATCKSATWNSAIHKNSATRKKVQHEKITIQKSATWKWCSMKKVQHEKSAI